MQDRLGLIVGRMGDRNPAGARSCATDCRNRYRTSRAVSSMPFPAATARVATSIWSVTIGIPSRSASRWTQAASSAEREPRANRGRDGRRRAGADVSWRGVSGRAGGQHCLPRRRHPRRRSRLRQSDHRGRVGEGRSCVPGVGVVGSGVIGLNLAWSSDLSASAETDRLTIRRSMVACGVHRSGSMPVIGPPRHERQGPTSHSS